MDIQDIRRAALKQLIGHERLNAFCDKYDLDPSYISQVLNKHRGFGEKAARNMERKIGLAEGSLDKSLTNVAAGPDIKGRLPHISWVTAGNLCDAEDPYPAGHAKEWLETPFDIGDGDYILTVDGESMYHPDGTGYSHGDLIHVKAGMQPTHGEDVIVRTPNGKATFKRYKESQDGPYLEAINPAWPDRIIKVPEGTVICGVIEGSWRRRRKR